MSNNVYVLTKEYNDYDQYGEYFVCIFSRVPSIEILAPILSEEGYLSGDIGKALAQVQHVRNGGGRLNTEQVWFWLNKVEVITG